MSSDQPVSSSDLDCFAASYAAARAKLQLAAAEAGGVVTCHIHPRATGPDGGSLAIDVASFGPRAASRGLLVLSGTHGGEGCAGSAAQVALVRSGALSALPPDTRVVLVHGLNPYGFAHGTRTTENNVDLNRNFADFSKRLPSNPAYLELHDTLCPAHWTPAPRATTARAIDGWIARNGRKAWLEPIMKGQYEDAPGLNYGGRAPEWSNLTLRAIVARELPAVRRLGFIDWHTGLGQYGEPFFLCFNERLGPEWQRACEWWGGERVDSNVGYEGSERPPYNGLVFYGLQEMIGPARMTGAVVEFGTAPIDVAFDQLRADRWLRFGEVPDDPALVARMRRGVMENFTPSDLRWRSRVVTHSREIHLAALNGLARWN